MCIRDRFGFTSQFRGSYNIDSRCPVPGCDGRSFQHGELMNYLTVNIDRRDRVSYALLDWCNEDPSVNWDSCPTCNTLSVTATRKQFIKDLPDTLVIHCNRFRRHRGRLVKNSKTFYPSMELTGAELAPCMASTVGLDKIRYTLSAMISHQGWSFNSGHYISYVKHDDDWFLSLIHI